MPLTIRRATSEDSDVVVDFNRRLAEESEGKKLDTAMLKAGGVITGCAFLVELTFLNGRERLRKHDVFSLIQF